MATRKNKERAIREACDALDIQDKAALTSIFNKLLEMFTNGTGAAAIVIDVDGSGKAEVCVAGNALIYPSLLCFAGAIGDNMMSNEPTTEYTQ